MHGFALQQQGKLDEAQAVYRRVLEKDPQDFDALHMSGLIAARLKNPLRAVELFKKAIEVNPLFAPAHSNLGASLKTLQRFNEAVVSYERAIALAPDTAEAHSNLGNALRELRRPLEALRCYDRAIAIKPDYADAFYNRGNVLNELRLRDEAISSFSRAFELNPGFEFLPGMLVHAHQNVCAWSSFDANRQLLAVKLTNRELASPPFPICIHFDSPALQKIAAEVWVQTKYPAKDTLGPVIQGAQSGRIRLGYFSADFYDHATSYLMAELFELHDRERFELFAFSFGPDVKDAMQKRVAASFEHFIDISQLSDLEAARMAREAGLDIAVDLKGYTQDSRPGIFAYRCAPVQVNYLGYPGTMGADYIDYLIADAIVVPGASQLHYTEKIAYLPNSYQVNDTKRAISDRVFTRAELGLPSDGFVYCCFNNAVKITPHTFESWMRILQAVEGSVLWLRDDNPTATQNLRRAAQACDVDPSRLVFGPQMPQPEHLARHRCADLFLDTLPCNAHTTISDALWAGLPALTLIGHAFAGRVAASLVSAMEVPELVTDSQEAYERLAIALARNAPLLSGLKKKIASKKLTAPLYDTPAFARHLEAAYMQMHERSLLGLTPSHLHVDP